MPSRKFNIILKIQSFVAKFVLEESPLYIEYHINLLHFMDTFPNSSEYD